jgi:ATP-dependent Clp protease ATP-binding subunit ClpA
LGVFLLLGGSGVGKTELAKRVSQQLFPIGGGERSGSGSESVDERGAMLRIDMSEVCEH